MLVNNLCGRFNLMFCNCLLKNNIYWTCWKLYFVIICLNILVRNALSFIICVQWIFIMKKLLKALMMMHTLNCVVNTLKHGKTISIETTCSGIFDWQYCIYGGAKFISLLYYKIKIFILRTGEFWVLPPNTFLG